MILPTECEFYMPVGRHGKSNDDNRTTRCNAAMWETIMLSETATDNKKHAFINLKRHAALNMPTIWHIIRVDG